MASARKDSPLSLTRRSLLKLAGLCGLASHRLVQAAAVVAPTAELHPRRQSLDGKWSLTYGACPDAPQNLPQSAPPAEWPTIPASVPGNVELDLVAAGKLEPLERGNRVYQALAL